MSADERAQKVYERFAGSFLAPLLGAKDEDGAPIGEQVVVGRPLGPGVLEDFAATRPSDPQLDAALFDALHAQASELAPVEALPYPERGTIALSVACYNLLAMTDPALDRALARRARPVVLQWVDALLDAVDAPSTRGEVLSRHAVVSRFLLLRRHDVVVTNWAYTYRYYGRPVPPRVVAWPKLRRVETSERQRELRELLQAIDAEGTLAIESRLRTLLSRSPATELLRTDLASDLRFGTAPLAMLSDPDLRYGLARELARQGLGRVAEPLGRALDALDANETPPQWLSPALALVWEVHALGCLEAHRGEVREPTSPSYPARVFLAVLPAVVRAAPGGIGALMELSEDDRNRLQERASALSRAVGMRANEKAWSLVKRLSTTLRIPAQEVHP